MSPAAADRWKRSAPHLIWGTGTTILWMLWQGGILDAVAGRLKGPTIDETVLVGRAVTEADNHARAIVDPMRNDVAGLKDEIKKLSENVAGMAGEMRAWREIRRGP